MAHINFNTVSNLINICPVDVFPEGSLNARTILEKLLFKDGNTTGNRLNPSCRFRHYRTVTYHLINKLLSLFFYPVQNVVAHWLVVEWKIFVFWDMSEPKPRSKWCVLGKDIMILMCPAFLAATFLVTLQVAKMLETKLVAKSTIWWHVYWCQ